MDLQKEFFPHSYHSQLARYEHDQGFSDEQKEPRIEISQNQQIYQSSNLLSKSKKTKPRFHEPKARLKFVPNHQLMRNNIQNSIADKQLNNRPAVTKSLQIRKKQVNKSLTILQPIFKTKRTLIGQNLVTPSYALQDFRQLKQNLVSNGLTVNYEASKQINTHGHIKKITMFNLHQKNSFIHNKYNCLLKQKIRQSFIVPKKKSEQQKNGLSFNSEIENGNLELAFKVKQNQYDLFLKIDTNTHGHTNWFYFQVANLNSQSGDFTFNICNIKRQLKLIQKGQKIFVKQLLKGSWEPAGSSISISQNIHQKIGHGRLFKLSFSLNLKQNTKYGVALLPPYTYSQMLKLVDQLQEEHKNIVEVDLLNYSLTGLAIPIITITNKQHKAQGKKLILISCRIHPGQSVASYVAQGLIKRLVDENDKVLTQFLKHCIIKIIPMLNPDGVVFGNFRTNYLGIDLNRAFHTQDQIINPEIWSLKNLGRQLKTQFGTNFLMFLDLHGHSSQKNIFSYGPNFQYNDPNFFIARLLPKILAMRSKYFKYQSCTFKLQQHKKHTARGFFLNQLNVMTYTIESSYCLFDDLDGSSKLMKVQDWQNFGCQLAQALESFTKIRQANAIRSNRELKTILQASQVEQASLFIKKLKNEVKKQIKSKVKLEERKQQQEDTDGESQGQDLNEQQRKDTQKKILQFSIPSLSLPRVLKPAILYPTITPKLFEVNEEKDESSFKVLYTKRSKYNTLRMMNANSMYANYLKNLDELEKFKPSAKNIKLQKKLQV